MKRVRKISANFAVLDKECTVIIQSLCPQTVRSTDFTSTDEVAFRAMWTPVMEFKHGKNIRLIIDIIGSDVITER